MGGEMVYILDQRLSAQEIVDQKAVKGMGFDHRRREANFFFSGQ